MLHSSPVPSPTSIRLHIHPQGSSPLLVNQFFQPGKGPITQWPRIEQKGFGPFFFSFSSSFLASSAASWPAPAWPSSAWTSSAWTSSAWPSSAWLSLSLPLPLPLSLLELSGSSFSSYVAVSTGRWMEGADSSRGASATYDKLWAAKP